MFGSWFKTDQPAEGPSPTETAIPVESTPFRFSATDVEGWGLIERKSDSSEEKKQQIVSRLPTSLLRGNAVDDLPERIISSVIELMDSADKLSCPESISKAYDWIINTLSETLKKGQELKEPAEHYVASAFAKLRDMGYAIYSTSSSSVGPSEQSVKRDLPSP